mgnify:CR=1 FL=1
MMNALSGMAIVSALYGTYSIDNFGATIWAAMLMVLAWQVALMRVYR